VRNLRIANLLPCAVLLLALPVMASSVNVVFYDSRYGTVNDATGAYTHISTLPVGAAGGIAAMNGLLYLEDFGNNLYSVDSVTGAAHLAGNTGMNLSLAAFGGGQIGLFAIDYASSLYSINASNGKASLVGKTGLGPNNGHNDTSLSSDGASLLYTTGKVGANDDLYRINIATGLATYLGSTGVTGIAGSAFVNGNLELYQYGQFANYIYWAAAGSTNFQRGAQLTAQIIDGGVFLGDSSDSAHNQVDVTPEPPVALLMGAGLLFMAARVHRRSRVVVAPIEPVVRNHFDAVQAGSL
jgi:hypothetical protein